MLLGIDVKWWSVVNDDVYSFFSGKIILDVKLVGLYLNVIMEVKFFYGLIMWEISCVVFVRMFVGGFLMIELFWVVWSLFDYL